ncbi:MAG: cytochrome c peroxidase [Nannocystaceae bacterium]
MPSKTARALVLLALVTPALPSCTPDARAPAPRARAKIVHSQTGEVLESAAPSASEVLAAARKNFSPLPERMDRGPRPSDAVIALGRTLYYDPRLSKNHDVSCNTCHPLDEYGADGLRVSVGHRAQEGDRNAPTVYNAALQFKQFWDGREPDVEAQSKGPIINPVEMAMADHGVAVSVLKTIPGYAELFAAAFPEAADPITIDNVAAAIGAFERGLTTPGPFDAFLKGDEEALSPEALRGLQLFMDVQCVTCHTGPGVGGTQFQKLGSVKAYKVEDPGRFKISGDEKDRGAFKVPILRNIAKTGPYFHDGSLKTLPEVVNTMAEYQTVKGTVSDAERSDLIAFLNSLTGEIDEEYIRKPTLPENGPKTPAPDPS